MNIDTRRLVAIGLIAGSVAVGGCGATPKDLLQLDPMMDILLKNHWIPLPIPDSKIKPGTIVTINKDEGVRYISDLGSCHVPAELLNPTVGSSPAVSFAKTGTYDAKLAINVGGDFLGLKGVSTTPEYSKVKKISVENEVYGGDALDLLRIIDWVTAPGNADRFRVCDDFLNRPDAYFVQESFRVSKGKYTLHDETNAKIAVTGLNAGPLKIDPGASAATTADGSLQFNQTFYTAIRRVKKVNGSFQTLGGRAADDDATAEAAVKNYLANRSAM